MTPAAISVALCTHNGAPYLAEQVRSICLQTLPPCEIVLSDDAATLDACLAQRPGLSIGWRVLRNDPALRVTKNFEQAARACSGELIAFSDQDDWWVPDRLARMAAEFGARPDLLLLHSDARLVDGARGDLGQTLFHALEVKPFELAWIHDGRAFDVFLRRNLVTGATAVFRRQLLEAGLPFPKEWVHDEWLGIVASAVGRVDVLEQPLIEYRQHGKNQIGARRDSFAEKVRKALASRGTIHQERAHKAELLLERLLALGDRVAPATIHKLRDKLEHQRFRAALPPSRVARCLPVLREAMTGRYNKFGRGTQGVVRDLFESV
jgi:glycosyltransferase involved in cell wall biosynthesis